MRLRNTAMWLFGFLLLSSGAILAQEDPGPKFTVSGDRLIYDTESSDDSYENEISDDDIDVLLDTLRKNSDIRILELDSQGGSVYAAAEMARIVIDFELDTVVSGVCFSSCVTLFLAGEKRQMMLGSKIGFHQSRWPSPAVQNYYEQWAEDEGWATPFEFTSWVYEDTQTEMFEDLTYMIKRGVDAEFAIKTKGVKNDDEWFPSRLELLHSGVLRD